MQAQDNAPPPDQPSRLDLTELHQAVQNIRQEVHKLIIGQDRLLDLLMATVFSGGHALIQGVPGVAKTMAAKLLARTLSVDFKRLQFTPDLMPADVLGTSVFNPKTTEFEFRPGPVFTNILLVDEINRAPAKTQSALFEVMEEKQVTSDGATRAMAEPFIALATQNPIEHEGTYRLPEAQLDRFLFLIDVGYPSQEEEVSILQSYHERKNTNDLALVQPILSREQVLHCQELVRQVYIEQQLIQYIAQVVQLTREEPALYLGASPRASLNIMTAAKAFAAMGGRDFVKPEDIQAVAVPVLQHRLILAPEREMEGLKLNELILQLLDQVEVPR
jgi:MoxR-like ATPase